MLQKLQVITKDFFISICKIYEYDIIEDPKGSGGKKTQHHFPGGPSFSTEPTVGKTTFIYYLCDGTNPGLLLIYCRYNSYFYKKIWALGKKIWDPQRLSLARQLEGEAVLLEGW